MEELKKVNFLKTDLKILGYRLQLPSSGKMTKLVVVELQPLCKNKKHQLVKLSPVKITKHNLFKLSRFLKNRDLELLTLAPSFKLAFVKSSISTLKQKFKEEVKSDVDAKSEDTKDKSKTKDAVQPETEDDVSIWHRIKAELEAMGSPTSILKTKFEEATLEVDGQLEEKNITNDTKDAVQLGDEVDENNWDHLEAIEADMEAMFNKYY